MSCNCNQNVWKYQNPIVSNRHQKVLPYDQTRNRIVRLHTWNESAPNASKPPKRYHTTNQQIKQQRRKMLGQKQQIGHNFQTCRSEGQLFFPPAMTSWTSRMPNPEIRKWEISEYRNNTLNFCPSKKQYVYLPEEWTTQGNGRQYRQSPLINCPNRIRLADDADCTGECW